MLYSSLGSSAYTDEKSNLFQLMSKQCARVIWSTWDKHHERAAADNERQEVYAQTQKGKVLSDQCL